MIFGGTALQTLILAIITIRCDWENEVYIICYSYEVFIFVAVSAEGNCLFVAEWQAKKANMHLNKWENPRQQLRH